MNENYAREVLEMFHLNISYS